MKEQQQSQFWFYHLVQILCNYLIIIFPVIGLVVVAKRTNLLPAKVKQWPIIRLMVYGVPQDPLGEAELPLVVMESSPDVKKRPPPTTKDAAAAIAWFRLLYCVCGLQISFLTWGILQEKIMTQTYELSERFVHANPRLTENLIFVISQPDEPETRAGTVLVKFRDAQFLVLVNRTLAFVLAVIVLAWRSRQDGGGAFCFPTAGRFRPQPPWYKYMFCSVSNILSSWCQYEALKYVSFPVQVLSKGFKMIPTMVMNSVMMGRGQKRDEWLFALAISIGMTIFLLNEKHRTPGPVHPAATPASLMSGFFILALYLTLDAFTSNWQQSLFDQFPRTLTSVHMMAAVNFYSILFTLTSLAQQSNLGPAFRLLLENSVLLRDCIILSICSAAGQLFIFYTIATFGAIIFSLIMTLRQALAILLSCLIYSHTISWTGFLGILIIFGSLFTKSFLKYREKKIKRQQPGRKSPLSPV